jgi:hypothetical protein
MQHQEWFHPIVDFLRSVGIDVLEGVLPGTTFLPGIAIRSGRLLVDAERLIWPGDLLHEAGHLAVLPAADRQLADDDRPNPADAEAGGELEAMAWAYAASVAIGLPLDVLIHDGGYLGNAAGLRQMYEVGIVPGLRGLCDAGLTEAQGFTPNPGPVRYPAMLHWLRP